MLVQTRGLWLSALLLCSLSSIAAEVKLLSQQEEDVIKRSCKEKQNESLHEARRCYNEDVRIANDQRIE